LVRPDGESVPVLMAAALLEKDVLVAFVLDVSRQKRAEEERTRLLEEREADLRFLEMFMGMLGHDLRNPLAAVKVSADLLRLSPPGADLGSVIDRIASSAQRMDRMVEQLLDITQIRLAGGVPLFQRDADLGEICFHAVEEIKTAHPGVVIDLQTEGDLTGEWDNDRMLQVVSNLVGNAVQHGRRGGAVDVRASDRRDWVELYVHNEAVIPDEVLPSIFDPFKRIGAREKKGSLGLGLFISRHIVDRHGGSIEVQTSAETGTSFKVRLPRKAQAGES
ncbi:MAG: sensor histidine kinase, partial [Myxococcota bacterium]